MTKSEILESMATGKLKIADALAMLELLERKAVEAAAGSDKPVTVKVSETTGCYVIGGLRSQAVCLYDRELRKLLGAAEMLLAFADANKDRAAVLSESETAKAQRAENRSKIAAERSKAAKKAA